MTTRQQNQRLSKIEGEPTFRIIDGVSLDGAARWATSSFARPTHASRSTTARGS